MTIAPNTVSDYDSDITRTTSLSAPVRRCRRDLCVINLARLYVRLNQGVHKHDGGYFDKFVCNPNNELYVCLFDDLVTVLPVITTIVR